ncbi:3-oxoacyl-[acyl-carrier protein] reductase [Bathymodiolus japonicus methanotrophic gill symbiont]|uniref:3-oxoacyl-ACP reductase FabG n=1 Tax=Bathymodiolus japonicus methanotrophic gill symbiont TaxID=113269 RepID=UPI001B7B9C17|nr:3-oxoacyl-ACP reductase FabG [Bathymodiolus japonicus methanotrophic gill symbiont]GFO73224.1 3-oxoacyl-[acyl-carrier protein] reductase [Bathymodiolus japonicus methanotrophic gill symbiont]
MKRALITGGRGDIGSAICSRLAQDNIHIIVHSNHNFDRAQSIADSISQQGGSAEAIAFDVCDVQATEAALKQLSETGLIQIIINNAGIHRDAPLVGMNRKNWTDVIDVSLHGFYNVTQPLLMPMIQSRWGRIINMSSVAGVMGNRGQCNYSAAKAALNGATKSLAQELASRKITVNAIAPGIIEGSMTENSFDKQMIKNIVPMKRAGKPEEVGALAAFLCSDEASYISGQIININGAMA